MIIMAIDGACRNNGKPNCVSVGSVFVRGSNIFDLMYKEEFGSTNQRGEINALLLALREGAELAKHTGETDLYIITDSEYVFNCIKKEWLTNWAIKGWITSAGEPVKNRDLWEQVYEALQALKQLDVEVIPFHIKGHLFSLGKVTSADILRRDPTGELLYKTMFTRIIDTYDQHYDDRIRPALELYAKNNEHAPPMEAFIEMTACNTVADLAAGAKIEQVIAGSS